MSDNVVVAEEFSGSSHELLERLSGARHMFHVAPLHYLPFIARSCSLLAQSKLRALGYMGSHFRSTSHLRDVARGFGDRVFLALTSATPLLRAKLEKGFPHIRFDIPVSALESVEFDLCRFDVAKNRSNLRRGSSLARSEVQSDGRYYEGKRLPVARRPAEKKAMLEKHHPESIEVQVKDGLLLSDGVVVACFSKADRELADQTVRRVECPWKTALEVANYPRRERYAAQVEAYCCRALSEPGWRGDGLEFDRFP